MWGKSDKLDPSTKGVHRAVGQEPDELDEELSVVGNSCHEHGLEGRRGARQQLDFAPPAHPGPGYGLSWSLPRQGEHSWFDAESAGVRVHQRLVITNKHRLLKTMLLWYCTNPSGESELMGCMVWPQGCQFPL